MYGIRPRRRAVTDQRWTLCLFIVDTLRAYMNDGGPPLEDEDWHAIC